MERQNVVGASAWSYFVPYQPHLDRALQELRQRVFAEGDYYWGLGADWVPPEERRPQPQTITELFADEYVQECGTHSILDMDHVLGPGEGPDYRTVEPVSAAEAKERAGTDRLTRAHIDAIDDLVRSRWFGRCAVLHDDAGKPAEIYFWGYSGD
ncbi:hypothetical protein [Micromonospora sp. NPDC005206]|uniref:hypothetical protein n=1 Tax=Micromonospora sp. NPDC005206 TaxID=3157022 RepID=UPI0033BBA13A